MFLHPFRCPDCGVECAAEDTYCSAVDGFDRCPCCHDEHTDAVARQDAARVYGADLGLPHILPEDYPLPPTRQLTDTERAVLRGMLP